MNPDLNVFWTTSTKGKTAKLATKTNGVFLELIHHPHGVVEVTHISQECHSLLSNKATAISTLRMIGVILYSNLEPSSRLEWLSRMQQSFAFRYQHIVFFDSNIDFIT